MHLSCLRRPGTGCSHPSPYAAHGVISYTMAFVRALTCSAVESIPCERPNTCSASHNYQWSNVKLYRRPSRVKKGQHRNGTPIGNIIAQSTQFPGERSERLKWVLVSITSLGANIYLIISPDALRQVLLQKGHSRGFVMYGLVRSQIRNVADIFAKLHSGRRNAVISVPRSGVIPKGESTPSLIGIRPTPFFPLADLNLSGLPTVYPPRTQT